MERCFADVECKRAIQSDQRAHAACKKFGKGCPESVVESLKKVLDHRSSSTPSSVIDVECAKMKRHIEEEEERIEALQLSLNTGFEEQGKVEELDRVLRLADLLPAAWSPLLIMLPVMLGFTVLCAIVCWILFDDDIPREHIALLSRCRMDGAPSSLAEATANYYKYEYLQRLALLREVRSVDRLIQFLAMLCCVTTMFIILSAGVEFTQSGLGYVMSLLAPSYVVGTVVVVGVVLVFLGPLGFWLNELLVSAAGGCPGEEELSRAALQLSGHVPVAA